MGLIKQTDFGYGVVNKSLNAATDVPQYLQSLQKGDNVFINSMRQIEKRSALAFLDILTTGSKATEYKTMSFETVFGSWYQLIIYVEDVNILNIILIKFKITTTAEGDKIEVNDEKSLFATGTIASVNDVYMTNADNFIVLTSAGMKPQRITIDENNFSNTTISSIQFAIVPSLDFGDLDYSGYTFTPSGTPMGSTIEVSTSNKDPDPAITPEWIGGMIIDEFGKGTDQPLGYGIITDVETLNKKQTLSVVVLTAFASTTANGKSISLRRPVWGASVGYPGICAFHKSRLWFAGTKTHPLLVASSKVNTPNDFGTGTGQPTDGICYLLGNSDGGKIKNMFGGMNLHIWTETKEFIISGGPDTGLTPGNFDPRQSSGYGTSAMSPVQYQNNIYFTTIGKAIIEVEETATQSASTEISMSTSDLIVNPIKGQVNVIRDTQEQLVYFLNEDGTIVVFSKNIITGVNAFTLLKLKLLSDQSIVNIDTIANNLLCLVRNSDGTLSLSQFTNKKHLDQFTKVSFKDGVASISRLYAKNTLDIIREDDNGNVSYFGSATSDETAISKDVPNGPNYYVGKIYDVAIETMNLFLNRDGSFYKKRASEISVEFYKSYDFKVNNIPVALSTFHELLEVPKTKTGIKNMGVADSYQQDNKITIYQNSPYPLHITSIGWIIDGGLLP